MNDPNEILRVASTADGAVVAKLTPPPPANDVPGEPPVCPDCGAVAEVLRDIIPEGDDGVVIAWVWATAHDPTCPWMRNPDAEPY